MRRTRLWSDGFPRPGRPDRPRELQTFKEAYAAWDAVDNEQELADLARAALDRLRTTLSELG